MPQVTSAAKRASAAVNIWWLVWICLTVVLWLFATKPELKYCLAVTAIGLIVMQVWKQAEMGDLIWLASCATWVSIAGATWRHNDTYSLLTLLSATCYAVGRVGGYEFDAEPIYDGARGFEVFPIQIIADAFGLAALSVAGGPGIVAFVGRFYRTSNVGRRSS